jgi:hypothetical protein
MFGRQDFEMIKILELGMEAQRNGIPEKERCRHCDGRGKRVVGCATFYSLYGACFMCGGTGLKKECAPSIEMVNTISELVKAQFGEKGLETWFTKTIPYFGTAPKTILEERGELGAEKILELLTREEVYYESIVTDMGNGASYCAACNYEFDIHYLSKDCEAKGKKLTCPGCGKRLISGGIYINRGGSDF